jgi:gluconokinase
MLRPRAGAAWPTSSKGSTVDGTTGAAGRQQPVLVVMGVSGSGKSTVAGLLAGRLNWPLEEGDDLHPVQNVVKMASGTPLTDDDRWPWLDRVAEWIHRQVAAGQPGVITCSALRRVYRDRLRGDHGAHVVFVYLAGSKDTVGKRLTARSGHFMPSSLLDSQLAALEPPGPDENAVTVDAGRRAVEEADEIIERLGLRPVVPATAAEPFAG